MHYPSAKSHLIVSTFRSNPSTNLPARFLPTCPPSCPFRLPPLVSVSFHRQFNSIAASSEHLPRQRNIVRPTILELSGCLPRLPKPDQHRRAPSAEDVAANGLKESASAQTWRKAQRRTGSISDTEYPDGTDLGGFKQTTSPADGRFREGKGLSGFWNSRCCIAAWSRDRTLWPNCRRSNADYPYHGLRQGLHEIGATCPRAV